MKILNQIGMTSLGVSNQLYVNIDKSLQNIEFINTSYINNLFDNPDLMINLVKEMENIIDDFNKNVTMEVLENAVNTYLKSEIIKYNMKFKETLKDKYNITI